MEPSDEERNQQRQVQIRFISPKIDQRLGFPANIDIPDYPLTVEDSLTNSHLHNLLHRLVYDEEELSMKGGARVNDVKFDFLIKNQLIRESLAEELAWHGLNRESILEIEVVQATAAPQAPRTLPHEDWVSCCLGTSNWDPMGRPGLPEGKGTVIVTGAYDCSINVWSMEGSLLSTHAGHSGPIKCLAETHGPPGLVTGSMDQTLKLWKRSPAGLEPVVKCVGHESSVEGVAVCSEPGVRRMVSVGFDTFLKVWDTAFSENVAGAEIEPGGSGVKHSHKRTRLIGSGEEETFACSTRTPIVTLAGHNGPICAVAWGSGRNRVVTASWDLSIKTWDLDLAGPSDSVPTPVAPTSLAAQSDLNNSGVGGLVAVGFCDPMVRIYDLRAREGSGSPVKITLTSHTAWVSDVAWSRTRDYLLASGSYDNLVKMWDIRSPRAPLFDLAGHTERVMGIGWMPGDSALASGGADSTLQLYSI